MNAKKSKAIRKEMKLKGVNPRDADFENPTFHTKQYFDGKEMKPYQVVNPMRLESWCGWFESRSGGDALG